MKQLKSILFLTVIGTSLFVACKKKELPKNIEENDPQFYFSGTVNGTPTTIKAGIDGYYMYSSYQQDANNLYSFIGDLKPVNCTSCPNSISIQINDHRLSNTNGVSGADSAFLLRYYPLMSGNPTPCWYSAQFYPIFNKYSTNYNWNFGDGTTSTQMYPTHKFWGAGDYNVCLTVQDTDGCANSLCNIEKIGNMGDDCKTSINSSSTSTLTATFTHSTIGLPPYNFLWNFGDGNTSTSAIPSHNFSTMGRYGVSLRVIDARNDTAYANLNYLTPNATTCTTNYLLTGVTPLSNPVGFSNVVINWTDASGNVYTSNDFAQPMSSYFKVLKAENYNDNSNGQQTKKLTVQFSCKVFKGSSSMLIENGQAVIVVAYK